MKRLFSYNFIIVGIIAITTLLNISSYFVLLAKTPPFTVFTGAVHYPIDYLDYLSYITQGKYHWLMASNLKSGESVRLVFLNWMYVLGGHLGWIMHLPPPITYQCMVVLGSVAYLVAAYLILKLLFPKNNSLRTLAFILFIISNAFPHIYQDHGSWVFAYFYPFENLGQPFIRLTNVPHHLLIQAAIMTAFAAAVTYWKRRDRLSLIVLAASGLFLASSQPLQWALVAGVLGIGGIFAWVQKYRNELHHNWISGLVYVCFPAMVFGLIGLPAALYLKHLFTQPPYSYTTQWESLQQTRISLIDFIILNGPIMFAAIIGLPFVLFDLTSSSFLLIFYSILVIALFFSPIPSRLGFFNNRFLSVVPTLTFAYISTQLLWRVTGKFALKQQKAAAWFCAFLLITITIPVSISHFIDRTNNVPTYDPNGYLPLGASLAYNVAGRVVGPNDTVLVTTNLEQTFPAFTGKHVFVADEFSTIDFTRKNEEEIRFFNAEDPAQIRINWLNQNHISYILTYAWAPLDLPVLHLIYQNQYAILYKVSDIK